MDESARDPMSTLVQSVEGWNGPEPIGTCSNGRLRWAPTWVVGWPEGERDRLVQWCRAHPDAVVRTDQSEEAASWLLWYFENDDRTAEPYTKADARRYLRLYGWIR